MDKINFINNAEPAISAENLNQMQTNAENAINNIWKTIYPIGALYISKNSTNPATLFGGTWEAITNDYLLNFITSGTGGEYTGTSNSATSGHKLKAEESGSPAHVHKYKMANSATDGTALSIKQIPAHYHAMKYKIRLALDSTNLTNGVFIDGSRTDQDGSINTASTGGGEKHTHNISTKDTNTDESTAVDASNEHTHPLSLKKLNMYGWIRTA